jgi:hypothetical protein
LHHEGQTLVTEESKARALLDFFDGILGTPASRTSSIDLHCLRLPTIINMSQLCDRFTEEEVWMVIKSLPPDKALGPDRFSARFLQVAWPIICPNVMAAFDAFWHLDMRNLHDVNGALLVLPKLAEATSVKDFRPISLIHVIGKLVSKVLANRLAPRLPELMQVNQSAFIKGRTIHDNFLMVQRSAKLLHARQKPSFLFKIDIAHAFDSVAWLFLLEILAHMGFPARWRDWISALLASASTKILLNATLGDIICHVRGLHQGDPLSHMLLFLVMEVLNSLIATVDSWSLFNPLGVRGIAHRASLYADDLVWFAPESRDLYMARAILALFEQCSGLGCNLQKCQLAPIRCTPEQVTLATSIFPCQTVDFPIRYLCIPLGVSKLPKTTWQPLLDRVGDRLPTWRGRLLRRSGLLTLIKTTMTVIPIHTCIAVGIPP